MNYSPPPAASDSLLQTTPAMALDEYGKLHLVWLEQAAENSPGRIMYAVGRYVDGRLQDSGTRSAK